MCCSVHPALVRGDCCQLPSGQVPCRPGWGMQKQPWDRSSSQGENVQNCCSDQAHLRLHLGTELSTPCAVRGVENSSRLMVAIGTGNGIIVREFDHVLLTL